MKGIFKLFILGFLLSLLLANAGCVTPRIVSACFYDSSEMVEKRIPLILSGAAGVEGIKRVWTECKANDECLCYEVKYKGNINEYASYIQDKLQTSSVRSFRLELKEEDRLEIHFDWEYDMNSKLDHSPGNRSQRGDSGGSCDSQSFGT